MRCVTCVLKHLKPQKHQDHPEGPRVPISPSLSSTSRVRAVFISAWISEWLKLRGTKSWIYNAVINVIMRLPSRFIGIRIGLCWVKSPKWRKGFPGHGLWSSQSHLKGMYIPPAINILPSNCCHELPMNCSTFGGHRFPIYSGRNIAFQRGMWIYDIM